MDEKLKPFHETICAEILAVTENMRMNKDSRGFVIASTSQLLTLFDLLEKTEVPRDRITEVAALCEQAVNIINTEAFKDCCIPLCRTVIEKLRERKKEPHLAPAEPATTTS